MRMSLPGLCLGCLGPQWWGHAVGSGPARDRRDSAGRTVACSPRAAVGQEPAPGSSFGAGGADRPQPPANALSMVLTGAKHCVLQWTQSCFLAQKKILLAGLNPPLHELFADASLAGDAHQQPPSHACCLMLGRRAKGPIWMLQAETDTGKNQPYVIGRLSLRRQQLGLGHFKKLAEAARPPSKKQAATSTSPCNWLWNRQTTTCCLQIVGLPMDHGFRANSLTQSVLFGDTAAPSPPRGLPTGPPGRPGERRATRAAPATSTRARAALLTRRGMAVDATIVSPVARDGAPRPRADVVPGIALRNAASRKRRQT